MKKKIDSLDRNWRLLTSQEKKKFKDALKNTFGKTGRPPLSLELKKKSIHIKLDPDVIEKFKEKAKKTGKPYQTLINEVLKKAA